MKRQSRSLTVRTDGPLAWQAMAEVVIARLDIPPAVEAKIRQKENHWLTGDEVREAVLLARDAEARWVEDQKNGRRVMARGTTYAGRPVTAFMDPLNPNDENEGTFVLRTAMTIE